MKSKSQQINKLISCFVIVLLFISFQSTTIYVAAEDCTYNADCPEHEDCVDGKCVSNKSSTLGSESILTLTTDCTDITVTTADCSPTGKCEICGIINSTIANNCAQICNSTTTTTPSICSTCDPYSPAPPCKEDDDLCSSANECCGGACNIGVCSSPTTPLSFRKIKDKSPIEKNIRLSVTASTCTTNPGNLPSPFCTVYRGNARWLNCWRTNGSRSPVASLNACGANSGCDLSNDQINQIKNTCTNITIHSRKVRCVMDGIRNIISRPSSVCRHFARCFKKVWEEMELSQEYTVRFFGLEGHAWNETQGTQGAGTSVVDVSNNIYYWCP